MFVSNTPTNLLLPINLSINHNIAHKAISCCGKLF